MHEEMIKRTRKFTSVLSSNTSQYRHKTHGAENKYWHKMSTKMKEKPRISLTENENDNDDKNAYERQNKGNAMEKMGRLIIKARMIIMVIFMIAATLI